ncbi:MAG: hypothetical protein JW809_00210 [Pirellulales bacterium]|nr:hypothetical protein [Pirellulales bacterium]
MTVAFRELGGSPIEQYDSNGFSARREFLIAWEDRDAFAVEILGEAAPQGGSTWIHYPGKENVFAVRVRYLPVDPDQPDIQDLASLTEGLNSYTHAWARAIVEYKTVNDRDRTDGPENESGTHLSYRMLYSSEYAPIGAGGWQWNDTSNPLPDDQTLAKWIPMTEHHLTWHQVINPPWETIRDLQGTVNASAFLGCAAGTLLFEGADANKLFRAGFEEGVAPFCWQIRYLFRERAIKFGGATHGWNHAYRENPAGWVLINNGSHALYDTANFSSLFQSTGS